MKLAGLTVMAERRWNELSGGEKQKVVLATALAQEPRLLLLVEPTVHLDIANQVEILELVKRLNRQRRLTVIAAIHDLNLAALYFDRLVLLKEGKVLANGAPSEVLTENNIREAFAAGVRVGADPVSGAPHVFILTQTPGEKNNGKY
jgi:iron complex transport system ATP-binding protein